MKRRKNITYKNVKCDKCEQIFSLNQSEIKYNDVIFRNEKATVYFFNCKHCKKMFIVKVVDEKLKGLETRLRASTIMIDEMKKRKVKPSEHTKKIKQKHEELKTELEQYLKELKNDYLTTLV